MFEVIYILGLIGVAVFSISGALVAGSKRFDLMGVICIALVTAIGGGTLRDILLDVPVFWISDVNYIIVILVSATLTVVYAKFFDPPDKSLLVADALGLALFTISGAQVAEAQGHGSIITVLMGAFTGAAGGVLRDVLCREVPVLFQASETLYASAAIIGVILYLQLQSFLSIEVAAIVAMILIATLRLSAIFWNWTLPVFNLPRE